MKLEPKVIGWADLHKGYEEAFSFVISSADMEAFAQLSGDYNPLHLDAEYSQSLGFNDCVVYGGLLVAQVSRLIGMQLPGRGAIWVSLDITFINPLLVGDGADLTAQINHISDATRLIEIGFQIRTRKLKIAKGSGKVMVK
jgi:acyl dehydratase